MLLDFTDPLTIGLVVVTMGLLLYKAFSKPARFPPGPPVLPLMGTLHFHVKENYVLKTIQKYGKIVGTYTGPVPAIRIYDLKVARKILSKDEYSGRPDTFQARDRSFAQRYGVILSEGPTWQEQRRFALRTLRDFGFGKKGMEGVLQDELQAMVNYFTETGAQPINMQNVFNVPIINVLWTMVANKRFSLGDSKVSEVIKLLTAVTQTRNTQIHTFRPWMRFIIPERWTGTARNRAMTAKIHSELKDTIREHRETFDEDNMRDFIDVYLKEIQKNHHRSFHEEQLIVVCLDLFQAGAETTSTTLLWAVLFLILNPQIQTKVQQEINEVIGQNRMPTFEDRGKLPYTEATIMEIQRLGSIVPNAIAHRTLTEMELEGYKIPKHATIFYSIYYMSRDPEYWDDPETFKPERFLDAEGKKIKTESLLPFGIGKRQCLGETLAKLELFFFLTGLLQHFTFSLPEGDPRPSVVGTEGIIRGPFPYRAVATQRM